MPHQPDPRYFDWGGQFQAGVDNAQQNQRRNALVDIERSQEARREGLYQNELQQQTAQSQQALKAKAGRAALLAEMLKDKPQLLAQVDELAEEEDSVETVRQWLQLQQPKSPGQLYRVGPQGKYATAEEALGQPAYEEPKAPPGPGQLYQIVGPDGKPQYVTAEEARNQQPFNKSEKPPVVADPAAQVQDAENVLAAINTAKQLIKWNTTGLAGQKLGEYGGTDAYDLRSALDTVKASIGFDRLQRMREESKTGGALGQVAVRELDLLQATIASIDANQSAGQLQNNLNRVQTQYQKAMNAYQKALGAPGAPTRPGQASSGNIVDFAELPD
jgi:hypothetical protein